MPTVQVFDLRIDSGAPELRSRASAASSHEPESTSALRESAGDVMSNGAGRRDGVADMKVGASGSRELTIRAGTTSAERRDSATCVKGLAGLRWEPKTEKGSAVEETELPFGIDVRRGEPYQAESSTGQ
jgi:hypothetical protein